MITKPQSENFGAFFILETVKIKTPHITSSMSQHSPAFKVPSLVQTLNQEKATDVLHHTISITRSILSESLLKESSK